VRTLRALRVAAGAMALIALLGAFSARAATNVVPQSFLGANSFPITPDNLKPPECSAIRVTSVILSSAAGGGTADALVIGTSGADDIRTGGKPNCILGGGGDDAIRGGGGDDVILGGPGADDLRGEGGSDSLYGGDGNDNLDGGGGTDSCDGGSGTDTRTSCETAINFP